MSPRILVIEDDSANREFIELLLLDEGYSVSSACDGEKGLAMIPNVDPQLILLDMIMPNTNGENFLKKYQDTAQLRVPIIVLTAAKKAEPLALRLGVAEVLAKPFDLNELLQSIQKYLEQEEVNTVLSSH